MTDSVARTIARYAITDFGPLDPLVRDEARRRVVDSVGLALGALSHAGPTAARRYARTMRCGTGSRIWGEDVLVPPEVAALVNGVAIRCLDFSDTYFSRDSTHPSDMLGGLVAVAEARGHGGGRLLEAIAVSYEVAVALCDALGIRAHGWDQTNITAVGGCAGVARLMDLDQEQTQSALAMTVVPRAGMLQARFGNVAMWKGFGGPDAVRFATYACALAAAGVQGPFEPFEGPRGMLALLLDGDPMDRQALGRLESLAAPARILDTHMKAWPVGTVAQGAVAAALDVHSQLDDGERIERARVHTFKVAIEVMGSAEKWAPRTRETADHSLPYVVTIALQDGTIGEAAYDERRYADPQMHAFLGSSVSLEEDPELTALYPNAFAARVEADTSSGRTLTARVDHPPGMAKNPLSRSALDEKFVRLCGNVLGGRAAEVLGMLHQLDEVDDLSALTAQLVVS